MSFLTDSLGGGGMATVPSMYLYGGIIAILFLFFIDVLVLAFVTRIPFFKDQLLAQIKKRPGLLIHSANRSLAFFGAKRAGKKSEKNNLDLPEYLATKFEPQSGFEEHFDRMPVYNYFTKGSNALKPAQVKALQDFRDYMGDLGITITPELMDVLFVEGLDIDGVYEKELELLILNKLPLPISVPGHRRNDEQRQRCYEIAEDIDELNEQIESLKEEKGVLLDEVNEITGLKLKNKDKILTLKQIKEDLETKIVKDGLFVWEQVEDAIFAASDMNSNNMSEAISIANAEALSNADKNRGQMDYAYAVIVGVTALIGIVIVMKFAFGG